MLNSYIAGLVNLSERYSFSNKIANLYGCEYFLMLLFDQEIETYLPAQGYPQTLPFDENWKQAISNAEMHGFCYSEITFPKKGTCKDALILAGPFKSIALLIGGKPNRKVLEPLETLLPLIVQFFVHEQRAFEAEVKVNMAEKSTLRAEKLTQTIDNMRLTLKEALVSQEIDKKEIRKLLNKKDEFMNIASHELKTPITSLKAYLQLMVTKKQDAASFDMFLQKANIQVNKVTELINDLLDVSKIQAGQLVLNKTKFDLTALLHDTIEEIELINKNFFFELKQQDQVLIEADRERVKQVVINLLTNAIKYSPQSTTAEINIKQRETMVEVQVTDTGIGIDPDTAQYIFERFFRVHTNSSNFSGLGLGLYISKEIIVRHDGEMGVKSNGTAGSTFWFTIPVAM